MSARQPKKLKWPQSRLAREISIALLVKLVLIGMLWLAFFSDPVDERLSAENVACFMLGVARNPSITSSPNRAQHPQKEPEHGC